MKPILFNTEMVKAIQNGTKTVTRRVIKFDTNFPNAVRPVVNPVGLMTASKIIRPPYQVGDILYVRETWQYVYDLDEHECLIEESGRYIYYADNPDPYSFWIMPDGTKRDFMPWKPSIHMPKEAARIFLLVTGVKVERLQEITEEQAEKEGCAAHGGNLARDEFEEVWHRTLKTTNRTLYGWDANPWVTVNEFRRISKEEALNESI